MKILWLCLLLTGAHLILSGQARAGNNLGKTPTYEELIAAYRQLDSLYPAARLVPTGTTDAGHPLYVMELGVDASPGEENVRILINNGIHPGEPCGVDASLQFCREMLAQGIPRGMEFHIIPMYNVGGALNRNCCSRANQWGPEEYGFRGNARNLDLNRDFIKADALNTFAFYRLFHRIQPHIFVDTHTSNGADYRYTMTLISTQKDKLHPQLGQFLQNTMEPELYRMMEEGGYEMIPYVNVFGSTPDHGYAAFLESPRYASGYTALFHSLGFITEAHMLKPYADRVAATLLFLHKLSDFAQSHRRQIVENRRIAFENDLSIEQWDLDWALDSGSFKTLDFKGYKYTYSPSRISGMPRLKYHRDSSELFAVKYYDSYQATARSTAPAYYVVPAAWREVVMRLDSNKVTYRKLKQDSTFSLSVYRIEDYQFAGNPYEGHFPLQRLKGSWQTEEMRYYNGDLLVPLQQKHKRFIMAVLEPGAVDSYLRWNFYDEIFQQKEWFSDYVFEETAEQMLAENPQLRKDYEAWRLAHPGEAQSHYMNLYFIYRHSPHYEKVHLRYPVGRIERQ